MITQASSVPRGPLPFPSRVKPQGGRKRPPPERKTLCAPGDCSEGTSPGWRAEPVQPIGCNDSSRQSLASESHQTNTCRHISKAGIARSSDSRATGRNSTSGATGEGGDYGSNGRATSDGAESGVSGGRTLKRVGSTAGGGGEYARHSHGGGGKMSCYSSWCYKRGSSGGIMGGK